MIPSSFLSSTGNTYTYTNPRSVNRNIWPMSTLKSCGLFDRSTCHSLRGWTSGTAIRGNLEWMMLCRTTKVPRLDTFGSLKPKKSTEMFFFENPCFVTFQPRARLAYVKCLSQLNWQRINKIQSLLFLCISHLQRSLLAFVK